MKRCADPWRVRSAARLVARSQCHATSQHEAWPQSCQQLHWLFVHLVRLSRAHCTPASPLVFGQVHYHGLDDALTCHWWPHMEQTCMPGAYVVTLDYRELLRRLPAGPAAGTPLTTNTLQLGGGGGGAARRALG